MCAYNTHCAPMIASLHKLCGKVCAECKKQKKGLPHKRAAAPAGTLGFRRLPEVCGLVVQTLVALGGNVPAEIALHAVTHEVLPVFLVVVGILCVAAGHIQLVGVVTGKGKAVAVAHGAVMDGVAQAAGLADDGRCAVAAGHHLCQTAGLALGGHDEGICTGVDLLRELGLKADVGAYAARVTAAQVGEEVLVLALAAAQNDQLDAAVHQTVSDALHQIKALHAHHAADHAKDGAAVLVQAKPILQGLLALCLALFKVVDAVIEGDVLVGGGVVGIHVDAVQNAAQLILLFPQQGVQTVTEPGVQDLLCVGGADRGDLVGRLKSTLHEVGAAIVLHDVLVTAADAAGIFQNVGAVLALVGNVVDGEHRLDAVELIQMAVVQVQVHGHQSSLPVVAVDDVRGEVDVEQGLQHGTGEEGETLAVIVKAVEAAALEVILVVEEVVGHTIDLSLEQAAVLAAPAHGDRVVGNVFQLIAELQVAIQRHDDAGVHAVLDQRFGQGAGHIGQTAGFCKGGCFRSSIQDLHKIRSFLIKRIHISSRCGKKSGRGYTQYPRPSLRGATGEGAAPMGDSQTVQTMWFF